jgi:colanic acid biosynthesis glycosyl transferase WcaI
MIFVNQSIGDLSNDILEDFIKNNEPVIVFTGRNIETQLCSDNIKYIFGISYNKKSFFLRFYTWLLFSIQTLIFLLINKKQHKDIFLVSNPPFIFFFTPLFKNHNLYLLVYDLYPDILKIKFKSDPFYLIALWTNLNKHIFRCSKIIFTIGESMKIAISKYTEPHKIHIINNWSSLDDTIKLDKILYQKYLEKYNYLLQKTIFVYSGNMGETHDFSGIQSLIKNYSSRQDVCFLFIGSGAKKSNLEYFKINNHIDNMFFLNRLETSEFNFVMNLCHFGIVALDESMANYSVPSKTFSYLGYKLPLLNFSTQTSEVYTLIEKYQVGINFNINNFIDGKIELDNFIENKIAYNELKNKTFYISQNLFSKSNAELYLKIIRSYSISKTIKLKG